MLRHHETDAPTRASAAQAAAPHRAPARPMQSRQLEAELKCRREPHSSEGENQSQATQGSKEPMESQVDSIALSDAERVHDSRHYRDE